LRKVTAERISGLGVHVDAYYGSAGLYLLPESDARRLGADADNIGDWPISTDWDPGEDHSLAFASHWGRWDDWFHEHLDQLTEDEKDEKFRGLLRVACEAVREVERSGPLDEIPKDVGFRIIISEHDEPDEWGLERYDRFLKTRAIRCYRDDARAYARGITFRRTSALGRGFEDGSNLGGVQGPDLGDGTMEAPASQGRVPGGGRRHDRRRPCSRTPGTPSSVVAGPRAPSSDSVTPDASRRR
jgi:hypothetical protein